jgi:hypothetical protein
MKNIKFSAHAHNINFNNNYCVLEKLQRVHRHLSRHSLPAHRGGHQGHRDPQPDTENNLRGPSREHLQQARKIHHLRRTQPAEGRRGHRRVDRELQGGAGNVP